MKGTPHKKPAWPETVRRVAEHLGGSGKLAERLGVQAAEVEAWAAGAAAPPTQMLLRLARLAIDDTGPLRKARTTLFSGRS